MAVAKVIDRNTLISVLAGYFTMWTSLIIGGVWVLKTWYIYICYDTSLSQLPLITPTLLALTMSHGLLQHNSEDHVRGH